MGHFIKKKSKKVKPLNAKELGVSPIVFHFALFNKKLIYDTKSAVRMTGARQVQCGKHASYNICLT